MKYFLFESATGDSRIAGNGVYAYTNERDAIAAFHQKLATAMKSDLYTSDLVMVIDSVGTVIKREYWAAPVAAEAVDEDAVSE